MTLSPEQIYALNSAHTHLRHANAVKHARENAKCIAEMLEVAFPGVMHFPLLPSEAARSEAEGLPPKEATVPVPDAP
jgi:hypothetical protein